MRGLIVMAMFGASLAHSSWTDYTESRDLQLDAGDLHTLYIVAGAGSMDVTGVAGLRAINVKATVVVPNADEKEAANTIEKQLILSLDRKGDAAELKAWFDKGFLGRGTNSYIALEVSVPQGLAVNIDDGSGSIDITDVEGDITIDDGSGSIDIENVARVKIDDGSGSIDITNAAGDVSIVDGSGSISVRHVQGSVEIDDGSGSIKVSDVEQDLVIVNDGSGGLTFSDIRGDVQSET